jgi:hypothetical protein
MSVGRLRVLAAAAGVACLLACAGCAGIGGGSDQVVVTADGVQASDPHGDGQPDIVDLTLSRSESSGAFVRVRLEGLRPAAPMSYSLILYIDPAGSHDTPRFVHRSIIDYAYLSPRSIRFRGWDLGDLTYGPSPTAPGCRPSERHLRPDPTSRVIEVEFPRGCIGSSGARIAVRTERINSRAATDDTARMPDADWWPEQRTMSATLRF